MTSDDLGVPARRQGGDRLRHPRLVHRARPARERARGHWRQRTTGPRNDHARSLAAAAAGARSDARAEPADGRRAPAQRDSEADDDSESPSATPGRTTSTGSWPCSSAAGTSRTPSTLPAATVATMTTAGARALSSRVLGEAAPGEVIVAEAPPGRRGDRHRRRHPVVAVGLGPLAVRRPGCAGHRRRVAAAGRGHASHRPWPARPRPICGCSATTPPGDASTLATGGRRTGRRRGGGGVRRARAPPDAAARTPATHRAVRRRPTDRPVTGLVDGTVLDAERRRHRPASPWRCARSTATPPWSRAAERRHGDDDQRAADGRHIHDLASVTKIVATTTAVLALVSAGQLALDDLAVALPARVRGRRQGDDHRP